MENRTIKFAELFNADVQAEDLAKFMLEQFIEMQSEILADEDEDHLLDVEHAVQHIKNQKNDAKEFVKDVFNDISRAIVDEINKLEVVPSEMSLADNGKVYAFKARINKQNPTIRAEVGRLVLPTNGVNTAYHIQS